jgi:phage terminase Nu1 subunit (DNA packaging protein)
VRKRTGAGREINKTEVADLFGVSLQTVDYWVRKGLACRKDSHEVIFNSAAVTAFLEAQAEARAIASNKPADADEARSRKLAAEAEIAEMQRDKMRGELVDISSVESVVAEEYAAVRSKLLALPGKLAPMVAIEADEIACRDLIERGVTEALDELARDAGEIAAGIEAATANDTPSGAESTAATDRQ